MATAHATRGVESEVPSAVVYPVVLLGETVWVLRPRARTSGLTRPSAVGPSELKDAIAPELLTAPQVMT